MMRSTSRSPGRIPPALTDERGAVLILVVFALLGLIAITAFAIDLGVMYTARNESQNLADGAALAGAAILLASPGAEEAVVEAEARKFAAKNHVRGQSVTLTDDDIEVLYDDEKVRVWVRNTIERGNPIQTFFAKVVGIESVDVVTMAAAQAWPAGGAECLIPIMLPDQWEDEPIVDDCSDTGANPGMDCIFTYNPPDAEREQDQGDDFYIPWDPEGEADQTYTGYSEDDYGLEIKIKKGGGSGPLNSSWYYPWAATDEEEQFEGGAAAYERRFTECDDRVYAPGDFVWTEPGAMPNPSADGIEAIIDQDPNIEWDPNMNDGQGCPTYDHITCEFSSPRIRPMPMFDPTQAPSAGRQQVQLTNFANAFVDRVVGKGAHMEIFVYFMGYAGVQAPTTDPDTNTPFKFLRLVE